MLDFSDAISDAGREVCLAAPLVRASLSSQELLFIFAAETGDIGLISQAIFYVHAALPLLLQY